MALLYGLPENEDDQSGSSNSSSNSSNSAVTLGASLSTALLKVRALQLSIRRATAPFCC
jgi:hypothetical protein